MSITNPIAATAFLGVDLTRERYNVVEDVLRERLRQEIKWGQQNHPDGTGLPSDVACAVFAKQITDANTDAGTLTWRDILHEEVCEAYAETDRTKLRAELVQVAAVSTAWVEAIDRRTA